MVIKRVKDILEKETSKSIGYVTMGKLASTVLGLVTISFMARGLSVKGFGELSLYLSIIELANLISLPGFNVILQKSLHHKDFNFYKSAYKYSLISSSILGSLGVLLCYIIGNYFNFASTKILEISTLAILFVISRSLDKSEIILPALKEFKSLSVFNFVSSFAKFLGLGLSAIIFNDIHKVIICHIVFQTLLTIFSYSLSSRYLKEKKSSTENRSFVKESIQMSFLAFFNVGVGHIDKLLLYSLSPSILGIYQAGAAYPEKFREVVKTFIATITNTWLSFGNEEFITRANKKLTFIIIGSVIGSTISYFSAHIYIPILLGDKYIDSIPVASLIGVAIYIKLLNYFFQSRDIVFESIKRHQIKIVIYRLSYILLLVLLIRRYEVYGVITTIIVSELLYFLMLIFDYFRKVEKELL